ncbi:hypothetical protein BJV74DRAFT_982310 [Russula compacta]|nr:hypothetical protein BJV74DRAFT_982310 [Russula compacta]
MRIVRTACPLVETLFERGDTYFHTGASQASPFAHISCHGILEIGKPFDAFFKLYKGSRLTLLDIVRSRLPTANLLSLGLSYSRDHRRSIANEGLHLAAAVQYSGFRSVVGTMWAMADIDGPVSLKAFTSRYSR